MKSTPVEGRKRSENIFNVSCQVNDSSYQFLAATFPSQFEIAILKLLLLMV